MLRLPTASVDLDALVLHREGQEFVLTEQEAALLRYLADRPDQAVARSELLTEVWGYAPHVVTRAIDATVSRLRAKLEPDPRKPRSLVSVRGKGYRLAVMGAPPEAALAPSPDPGSMLGRRPEHDAAEDALQAHRVVQLRGPGGVGKTTLARQLCQRHEGVFVDLTATRTLAEVPTTLARTLGVPLSREGRADSVDRIVDHLRHHQPLVVLDNLEQLPPSLGDWVQQLHRRAGTPLVLTSRQAVVPSWPVVDLGPLHPDAARALLVRAARRAAPVWSPDPDDALDRLADAVDRIPLALELMGARLPALGAEALVPRLRRLLHRGDGRSGRHSSLAAAVAWSWDLLGPLDRRRLAWWSTFRGPVPVDAAEAMGPHEADARWGADPQDHPVVDTLLTLADASLLDPSHGDGARPWVAVRAWAAEQLTASGEREAAEDAHAAWLASRVPHDLEEVRGEARRAWLAWAMDHREDLMAAVQRLAARRPARSARLALGLLMAKRQLEPHSVDTLFERALTAATRADDPLLLATVHLDRARHMRVRAEGDEQTHLDAARALLDAHPHAGLDALWHDLRANSLRRRGAVEASLEVYARGRALAEAAGARRTLAKLQHDEASSLRRLRRLDEAQQLLLPAIAFYRASGDLRLEALARQTLAAVMRARGQVDEALRLGDAAIAVARRAGDPFSLSEAVAAHGNALTQVGRPADARRFLEEAVALQRTIGNVIGLSFTLGNLGAVLEHLDEPLEAELVTGEALQVADEAGVPYAAAFWRYRLAQLAHQRDAVQEACDGYRAAIERLDAQQAVPQIHHAQACAATAEAERGDLDAADALLGRAAPLARGNPLDRTVLTLCDAAVARWAGRPTPEGVDEALVFARSEALLEPVVRMHDRSPAGDQGV